MPFFTFEGIDGSGKSSLINSFAQHLRDLGHETEITREPGGSPLGQEIRTLLLKKTGEPPCPEAELLLYVADRAQHVAKKILPLLKKKVWVLSDRFGDSSVAFQGAGRKIATSKVKELNAFATQGLTPDLTVIVDCPVDVSEQRMRERETKSNTQPDRFEAEKKDFHQAVRSEYLKMSKEEKRFFVVDGTQSPPQVLESLLKECKKRGLL